MGMTQIYIKYQNKYITIHNEDSSVKHLVNMAYNIIKEIRPNRIFDKDFYERLGGKCEDGIRRHHNDDGYLLIIADGIPINPINISFITKNSEKSINVTNFARTLDDSCDEMVQYINEHSREIRQKDINEFFAKILI